ncbi:MAG: alanine racemase [Chlorobi bacterium]|nr:alanine racemase [Chlorobiota bacterium]
MNTAAFYDLITVPTMVLREAVIRKNINRMTEKITAGGATFRPHFKTHQSLEIGQWFRDAGTDKITVSSLEMAAYFASDHWEDITVAFPVNLRQHTLINKLAGKIRLGLVAEDAGVINALDHLMLHRAGIWLKIDTGYHRTGIPWDHFEKIEQCIDTLNKTGHLFFQGLLSHSGNTYQAKGTAEVFSLHELAKTRMLKLRDHFRSKAPDFKTSMGDTPSCSIADDFSGIDEWRPGNFVFYDLTQVSIGSCRYDDIAAIVACPVVAIHPERLEAVIYGGAIHFSKDRLVRNNQEIFGQAVRLNGNGWSTAPLDIVIRSLSQEHGIVQFKSVTDMSGYQPGGLIGFYPVHSCLTANLLREYLTTTGRQISHLPGLAKPAF